jgi:hypothetical protein
MSIFISPALVLSSQRVQDILDNGIMCFNNIVTPASVSASSESAINPIENVTNPATAFIYEAANTSTQTITIQSTGSEVDYVGIARHNLNQIGLRLSILYNGITVVDSIPVSDTQALLFLQNVATPTTIELVITGSTVPIRIGVLYVGKSLRLERGIGVGHTPITYGRDRVSINGVSDNGQYLGPIDVRQVNNTNVSLMNLTPDWYRANLDPYFDMSPRVPCFFAWKPEKYPNEVGYVWVVGNPRPVNQRSNGMLMIEWNFRGLA